MSAEFHNIVKAIVRFDFSDYGLDDVEETKHDTATSEWIYDLAHEIERTLEDKHYAR